MTQQWQRLQQQQEHQRPRDRVVTHDEHTNRMGLGWKHAPDCGAVCQHHQCHNYGSRGEIVRDVPPPLGLGTPLLLVKPPIGLSTPAIFK